MINCHQRCWQKTTYWLSSSDIYGKTYVFSHSVLCMGKMNQNPISAWKEEIEWFMNASQCLQLDRIDVDPMEFTPKIVIVHPGSHCILPRDDQLPKVKGTRRLVQYWRWPWVTTKDVTDASTSNQESTTKALWKFRKMIKLLRHDLSVFTTRRRWSSWIPYFGTDVCLKIRVFSALVNSNMAVLFAVRRWSQE